MLKERRGDNRFKFQEIVEIVRRLDAPLGEFIWVTLYRGFGYFFSSQWDVISQSMLNVDAIVAVVAITAAGVYFWRTRVKNEPSESLKGFCCCIPDTL